MIWESQRRQRYQIRIRCTKVLAVNFVKLSVFRRKMIFGGIIIFLGRISVFFSKWPEFFSLHAPTLLCSVRLNGCRGRIRRSEVGRGFLNQCLHKTSPSLPLPLRFLVLSFTIRITEYHLRKNIEEFPKAFNEIIVAYF